MSDESAGIRASVLVKAQGVSTNLGELDLWRKDIEVSERSLSISGCGKSHPCDRKRRGKRRRPASRGSVQRGIALEKRCGVGIANLVDHCED